MTSGMRITEKKEGETEYLGTCRVGTDGASGKETNAPAEYPNACDHTATALASMRWVSPTN